MLVHKVLIDYMALGWAKKNEDKISKEYEEILKVGTLPAPDSDSGDDIIGSFCEEHNCNLITSDYEAYVDILENKRIGTVQISKYAWDEDAKRHIYLIRIL